MTAPMAPVPAPVAGQNPPVAPAAAGPGQVPAPPAPAPAAQEGGQSATDAAAESADPMAWLAAAEMDSRFESVNRPALQTGVMG